MTIKELIEEYLEQERQNVFLCASDYRMNSPKRGCERHFHEAQQRAELLEELLGQLP